jgi:hypothetical protein
MPSLLNAEWLLVTGLIYARDQELPQIQLSDLEAALKK